MLRPHAVQLLSLFVLGLSGCALFSVSSPELTERQELMNTDRPRAADGDSQVPIRRILRMESSVVTALETDRRIRELVWEELDESGPMTPEDRQRLNQSGLRIGVCGGSQPWALAGTAAR
ncbi:MAG: hypothetical protein R3C49_11945 [Planctomycetaceae bacterium]